MYDNNYEEYIRTILGYPSQNNFNPMYNNMSINETYVGSERSNLEDFYPEIYKIIYPMVRKACERNSMINTEEDLERLTEEIYSALEDNNQINVNINLGNNVTTNTTNRNDINKELKNSDNKDESREEKRIFPNNNLRDLIRILLIRELLRRPHHNFPPRPNPRPPMRPPIRPREYPSMYDIYEY